MTRLLLFADLKERGIVSSWPQLKRLQTLHGFPLGRMLSPNIRVWPEKEIDEWTNVGRCRLDIDARIDHRSLEAQGIALEPQSQAGAPAHRIEDQGLKADRGRGIGL